MFYILVNVEKRIAVRLFNVKKQLSTKNSYFFSVDLLPNTEIRTYL